MLRSGRVLNGKGGSGYSEYFALNWDAAFRPDGCRYCMDPGQDLPLYALSPIRVPLQFCLGLTTGSHDPIACCSRYTICASMPTLAAVDIGSNSVRLKVSRLSGRQLREIHEDRQVTRLGEGVFRTGLLTPEAISDTVKAL